MSQITTLTILQDVLDDMVAHAQEEYPKEACGILAGPRPGVASDICASRITRMTNVDNSPVSYTMDPTEQLQVEKTMRTAGEHMVAIYHSHTATQAYPSPTDVTLAVYPDVSYVLVSLKDRAKPDVKSYRITDGQIILEGLNIQQV
jgi:[CysO sulfur-carrier protein]-S-L-cysteine hydrolase